MTDNLQETLDNYKILKNLGDGLTGIVKLGRH